MAPSARTTAPPTSLGAGIPSKRGAIYRGVRGAAFLIRNGEEMCLYAFLLVLLVDESLTNQGQSRVWRVSEQPILSIGSRDQEGPELFGAIAGATRLNSGSVVVADAKNLELRFFSRTGKHLTTSGRRGEGPGEFRNIAQVQRCSGDSVFVYDGGLFRISVFSPEGAFVRTAPIRKWLSSGLTPYDFWCNPTGVLAFVNRATSSATAPKSEGPLRHQVEIVVVTPGDAVVSLGTFPASEMYFRPPAAGPRHLGKRTTVGVGSTSVFVGTGDAFEIQRFSLDGKPSGVVRESRQPVVVTDDHITAYVKDYIAHSRRSNASRFEQYFRELQWPKTFPAYARVLVDASENLWIEEYPIPGNDIRSWSIYEKSGARIAKITLPRGFELREVGRDYVLGIWHDEFEVDYLRIYNLLK